MQSESELTTQRRDDLLPGASQFEENLAGLATEQQNPASAFLDELGSLEMVLLMNAEDARVAEAVAGVLPAVAQLVDLLVERFRNGGRLFYTGAGTSGRLGTLDAVECRPTFGVSPEMVQCLMAGGPSAWQQAVEGAEDSESAGTAAVAEAGLTQKDVLVGIAASGRTPFVMGAVIEGRERGCLTGAITNHPGSPLGCLVDIAIEAGVGPEVVTGSTRLKAGTAQKMILNMISTASMVRLGKVYGNLMVDVQATNTKLRDRARRIVAQAAQLDAEAAAEVLERAGGSARTAILIARLQCDRSEAELLLEGHGGSLRAALRSRGLI